MSACSSGVRLPKTVESNLFAWVVVVWQYVKTPTWRQLRIKNSFHGAIKLCSVIDTQPHRHCTLNEPGHMGSRKPTAGGVDDCIITRQPC